MNLTDKQRTALASARYLAENGGPVFRAPRDASQSCGFRLPSNWQHTQPDPAVVDAWQPGEALCLVTGVLVDVVDVDPRNNGDLASLNDAMPRSYGRQTTPSGGTHDLIALLGVGKGSPYPGIDVQAGDRGGEGRGFVFLAPTERPSKVTGEPGTYEWVVEPNVDLLTLVGGDESGAALAAVIRAQRSADYDGPPYDGPVYADLTAAQRADADESTVEWAEGWRGRLEAALAWPEGHRDDQLRGWEALCRDWAWACALRTVAPWSGLDPDAGRALHDDVLPTEMAAADGCGDKWSASLLRRAAAKPVEPPNFAWAVFDREQDDLFDATPTLAHVRQAAHARLVGAPALLCYVLARVLAEVPPSVCLPPVVGGRASLNLGIAVVGESGSGKTALVSVSRELLGFTGACQEDIEKNVGSGEGLVQTFLDWDSRTKAHELVADPRRIVSVDEIDSLGAGKNRTGATIAPTMRSALTGSSLGQENAEATRRRHVRANSYRLVMLVGVQPTRSGALLDDADAGTPQRLVWVRAADPSLPDEPPAWPGPLPGDNIGWALPAELPQDIVYPAHVVDEVQATRLRHMREGSGALEGHLLLTRLKVAAGLALLHGEPEISDQWWDLAGRVIEQSMTVQAECKVSLSKASREAHEAAAIVKDRAEDAVVADQVTRAARAVRNKLQDAGGEWLLWRDARPAARLRPHAEEALKVLVAAGDVEIDRYVNEKGTEARRMRFVGRS